MSASAPARVARSSSIESPSSRRAPRRRARGSGRSRSAPASPGGQVRPSTRRPRVAFLFPGQGAQYGGMGRALYAGSGVFRAAVERVAGALEASEGARLRGVIEGAVTAGVDETATAQVALFAVQWGLAEVWRGWGVQPAAVVGHSVGEYAAACVAGVVEVEAAARVVAARGRLMGALPGGGAMAAVSAGMGAVRGGAGGGAADGGGRGRDGGGERAGERGGGGDGGGGGGGDGPAGGGGDREPGAAGVARVSLGADGADAGGVRGGGGGAWRGGRRGCRGCRR